MKAINKRTIGYTTEATIIPEDGEILTAEKIEQQYFFPFGGHIYSVTDTIAHICWYND